MQKKEKLSEKSNIELNADINTETVFQIGSITKQFTVVTNLMPEEKKVD